MIKRMTKAQRWMFALVLFPLGLFLFVFLCGEVVKGLWNRLMPHLFGWPELTFWQALGLLMLSRILFGGVRIGGTLDSWTPEEREQFRRRLRERLGVYRSTDSEAGPGGPLSADKSKCES